MAKSKLTWLVPATVTGALVPFVSMVWRLSQNRLGANPIATALNQLGLLSLIFLCASLSCTPLKIAFAWNWPLRVRRTLGLCAFFSVALHFLVYLVLDQSLAVSAVVADILKRPFIALGFAAFVCLVPLALTSTKRSVARLGFRRWQLLHRLAYLIGVLAVLHFYLRVKANHTQPIVYGLILALGFALRGIARLQKSRAARARERTRNGQPQSA
ncbi:MAG TPA: protein-methionine-sulfoxide reductase heme-binding subunit MsrQ [Polyangiaceae bacterium]|nr:protein-methionine-sulfoxide reductase heme-binding subunit MsrQ [Polyangiaceae bacterium]